ncbi:MAG: MOSC domain-containing protein [Desulfosarcinaceae bacterium]|nr:MOSC domain-containing protein [Desulfosarcinaceae bacterium]
MSTASVTAVSISQRKGEKKLNLPSGELRAGHGLVGDAHAGDWHRQISLLAEESIARIRAKGLSVNAGDFAENLTTKGIELWRLPVGTRLRVGSAVRLEVTQIGKTCHQRCAIFHQVGDCVMPREGIFARVLTGGTVLPGDPVAIERSDDGEPTAPAHTG